MLLNVFLLNVRLCDCIDFGNALQRCKDLIEMFRAFVSVHGLNSLHLVHSNQVLGSIELGFELNWFHRVWQRSNHVLISLVVVSPLDSIKPARYTSVFN